jgi:hypothetical protein
MKTIQETNPNQVRIIWLAVTLAMITALAYLMIAWKILGVGDLKTAEDGDVIVYVAAGCYLLGGLLILLRRHWLWIIGLVINTLVVLFFFNMYQARPSVMLSAGGVVTKLAQILLEAALLYLVVSDWLRSSRRTVGR